MNNISPQDMERYRSRLACFNLGAVATDNTIRSLHLLLSVIIDNEIRKGVQAGLKDSFLASAGHASLGSTIVDLAAAEKSKGANNIAEQKQGLAP